jgi:hypothetical protein
VTQLAGNAPRVLRGSAGLASWQPRDGDGEPADPGAAVTVGITSSDGTVLVAPGTATAGTGTAVRTMALTPGMTAQLDVLTATWTVSGVVRAVTYIEVVGGYYYSTADLVAAEPALSDAGKFSVASLVARRAEVEALFESACSVAFVPRFTVERLQVTGRQLALTWPQVRAVRWVRQWTYTPDIFTSVGASDIARTNVDYASGVVDLATFYAHPAWLSIGYEHGYDAPPADLKRAALTWARMTALRGSSGVPDRATSMQMPDGGSVTLATPGVGTWRTGVPSVDEVLKRYDHHSPVTFA